MLTSFQLQVVRNIREQYGKLVSHIPDEELLELYDTWDMSDKAETFEQWIS